MPTDSTYIHTTGYIPNFTLHTSPSHISSSSPSHTTPFSISEVLDSLAFDPYVAQTSKAKAPYPTCLKIQSLKVEHIIELFKQVKVNVPLLEAIQQVPTYVKFLKDLS